MEKGDPKEISLREFRLDTIVPEQTGHIVVRLVLLNTKPGRASTYLVTAYPDSCKHKGDGPGGVEYVWPEVVIGIMVETHGDGNQTDGTEKSWNLYPTMKNGIGWRKRSVMMVRGRNYAARCLLGWWAEENENKLMKTRRES